MPARIQKEAPLTAEQTSKLNELTARHLSTDAGEPATTVGEWKALGNACFTNGSFLTAIKCYTKAIADIDGGDTAVLRSNRSAAYLKSSMFSGPSLALKDAERAVALEPQWFKGYLRMGDAQFARHKFEEAEAAYETAPRLDPSCTAAAASKREVAKERFLRDLDAQDRERRRAEDDACEQLRDTEVYASAVASVGVGRSLNATVVSVESGPRAFSRGADGDSPHVEGHNSEPRRPLEFHNAPLRFPGADDAEDMLMYAKYGSNGSATGPLRSGGGSRRPPTEEETAELIRTWKRDLVPMDGAEGTENTMRAPWTPSSSSAANGYTTTTTAIGDTCNGAPVSSGVGLAYKERLMHQFRSKVETDEDFSSTLRQRREEELRIGEQVDYREGDRFRKVYARSTNAIGLGISTDAYKEFAGEDRSRW